MIVKNFYLVSAKENLLRPNITANIGDSLFEFVKDEEYWEYINNRPQGIRWEFAGEEKKIFDKRYDIFGLPTPDFKYVVVIYPPDHEVYVEPGNAAVYNADGSVHLQLKVPKLISPLAKQRERFMKYEVPFMFYFDRVRWVKNSKGEVITAVRIGFDRDWLEERELNPETGEFGELLSSGQR